MKKFKADYATYLATDRKSDPPHFKFYGLSLQEAFSIIGELKHQELVVINEFAEISDTEER